MTLSRIVISNNKRAVSISIDPGHDLTFSVDAGGLTGEELGTWLVLAIMKVMTAANLATLTIDVSTYKASEAVEGTSDTRSRTLTLVAGRVEQGQLVQHTDELDGRTQAVLTTPTDLSALDGGAATLMIALAVITNCTTSEAEVHLPLNVEDDILSTSSPIGSA